MDRRNISLAQRIYMVQIFFIAQGIAPLTARAVERNLPAGGQSRSIEQFNGHEVKTLAELLSRATEDKTSWYLDGATGAIVFTESLVVDPSGLPHSEVLKLKSLMEIGQWTESGVTYDFRKVAFVVRDGKGGLGDILAGFFSRKAEPQSTLQSVDPSLSAAQIVESLVKRLDLESFYFDDATETFVVTGEIGPIGELDKRTFDEVWDILASGEVWQAPSGQRVDFRSPSVIYETHRRSPHRSTSELRRALRDSFPAPPLERLQSPVSMMPFTPCNELLENSKGSSNDEEM